MTISSRPLIWFDTLTMSGRPFYPLTLSPVEGRERTLEMPAHMVRQAHHERGKRTLACPKVAQGLILYLCDQTEET